MLQSTPPKPPNSVALYSSDYYARARSIGATKPPAAGWVWTSSPASVHAYYTEIAKKVFQIHLTRYPGYSYASKAGSRRPATDRDASRDAVAIQYACVSFCTPFSFSELTHPPGVLERMRSPPRRGPQCGNPLFDDCCQNRPIFLLNQPRWLVYHRLTPSTDTVTYPRPATTPGTGIVIAGPRIGILT